MRITTPDHVLFRELDGEAVLLDLQCQQYFGLDELGTRIWTRLQAGADPTAIAADIAAEYDTPPERARADVERLIAELLSARLIEVHEECDA